MLIVMKADATDSQVEAVLRVIEQLGYKAHPMPGMTRTAIGITGNPTAIDPSHSRTLAVAEAIRVSKPYKLITLDLRPERQSYASATRRSVARSWRSSLVHAQSRVAHRRSRSLKQYVAAALVSFAVARSSRALHLTPSRVSAKKD